jgi:OmpA-OmpF porin, OOP family
MKTHVRIFGLFILFLGLEVAVFAQNDLSGCKDHPIITRYPGAVIEYCDLKNYTEFAVATGPETGYRKIDDWISVAGKQNRIYYSIKGDRTVAEVYQNYLSALNKDQFNLLTNKLHPERNVSGDIGGNTWLNTFYHSNPFPTNVGVRINHGSGTLGGTFYIAAQKGNIYLTISGKQYTDNETVVLLDVLETEDLEDDLIIVDADYIADKIFREGKIALQGIHFDHNQATIKEESNPLLSEIAGFLKQNPTVVIFVVGHTDMTGEVQYNIDLSSRRARAVTDMLINEYQIAASRMIPQGVGPLAPVDNNTSEPGKAKNRRVELVLKSR